MTLLREAWARLLSFFRKQERDRDFDEELASHIELAIEENLRRGMGPAEARRQARIQLGGIEQSKEAHRETRGLPWLEAAALDLRYAMRSMRRTPGLTLAIIAVLSIGVGANTAVFTLLNTLMLRSLPVREPGQLVEFLNAYPGDPRLNVFHRKYLETFRARNKSFSDITGIAPATFHVRLEGADESEEVLGGHVAGNFFSLLGMDAELGRLIGPEDDLLDSPGAAVAVVSWSHWNSRFRRDPGILGTQIIVNRAPVTIVGVTRREFSGLQVGTPQHLWLPTALIISPAGSRRIAAAAYRPTQARGRHRTGAGGDARTQPGESGGIGSEQRRQRPATA